MFDKIPQYEVLVKNTDFFDFFLREKYVPTNMTSQVYQIWEAYKIIDPNYKDPFGCPPCVADMIRMANIHRVTYLQKKGEEPIKMTFPEHKKKKK